MLINDRCMHLLSIRHSDKIRVGVDTDQMYLDNNLMPSVAQLLNNNLWYGTNCSYNSNLISLCPRLLRNNLRP